MDRRAWTGAALASVPLRRGWAVRPVTDADADGLVALVGGVFAEYPGCVLDPDGLDADLFAWRTRLDEHDGDGWVVLDADGTVVACVGVAPSAPGTVELKRLYVAAGARRRGLGAALVRLVVEWGVVHGAPTVELWTDTRFTDAHRLYDALGFVDDGARRRLDDPSDTTEAHLVLPPGGVVA